MQLANFRYLPLERACCLLCGISVTVRLDRISAAGLAGYLCLRHTKARVNGHELPLVNVWRQFSTLLWYDNMFRKF